MKLSTKAVFFSIVSLSIPVAIMACGPKKPPKPVEPATTDTSVDAGDAGEEDAAPPAPQTLYDRLGGKDGITAIVDSFVKNVSADPDVKKSFAKAVGPKPDAFKQAMSDQLCESTGGPCKYAGKDVKSAAAPLKITDKEWDALVKDLTLALQENKIGDKETGELLAIVAPMHDDIVVAKKK